MGATFWQSDEHQKAKELESHVNLSTIEEVRAAEASVQKVLGALKKADARDANDLSAELKNATDEYAKRSVN